MPNLVKKLSCIRICSKPKKICKCLQRNVCQCVASLAYTSWYKKESLESHIFMNLQRNILLAYSVQGGKVQWGYPYVRQQPVRQGQTTTPGTACPTIFNRYVCMWSTSSDLHYASHWGIKRQMMLVQSNKTQIYTRNSTSVFQLLFDYLFM